MAVLFSRMLTFSAETKFEHIIPLNATNVTVINKATEETSFGQNQIQSSNPGFVAYDKNAVWQSETQVEIFRFSDVNYDGKITVQTSNGDKVFAPRTSNEYVFTLENTRNVPLDYTLIFIRNRGENRY